MPQQPHLDRTKVMPCRVCGNPVTVRARTRKAPRCLECSIRAALQNQREMHERSGPGYEKWYASRWPGKPLPRRGTSTD